MGNMAVAGACNPFKEDRESFGTIVQSFHTSVILTHLKNKFPQPSETHHCVFDFSSDFMHISPDLCLALFGASCSHCVLCPRMPIGVDVRVPDCSLLNPQRENHRLPCLWAMVQLSIQNNKSLLDWGEPLESCVCHPQQSECSLSPFLCLLPLGWLGSLESGDLVP